MAMQGIEALDVLQTRLTKMLDVMADLREQNQSLQSRVDSLEKEVAAKSEEVVKIHEEYKQLVAEREIVRNKVEGMLKHLETFELA